MTNIPIAPVLVGRGMAGKAILRSLDVVAQVDRELPLLPVRIAERGAPLKAYLEKEALNVLFLANPSGLHAQCILDAVQSGFAAIATDKPVCVRPEEISLLQHAAGLVTVFHGYRVMWGCRTIKQIIESGELGEVFAFESRYWQSSGAQAALGVDHAKESWKNDIRLNGPHDALTDLGSHAVDICLYLMGAKTTGSRCWLSYRNSSAAHRDTHVHLQLAFSGSRRALFSISKTAHGATNDFEYSVFGTRGTVTWRFIRPDEIEHGCGSRTTFIRREVPAASSETKPFHGLGWLEGYVEITRQTLRRVSGLDFAEVPVLKESLDVMDVLLNTPIEL
ncbi:MAG TPA: Gfo/Idh/MocA family oxidoreductase [Acidobacteriota bacterium]|nr:Gfo/Idh/MocA family oxidoreductase [Acidobacteriota bacterium]